jgi:hypothetical protein
MPRENHSLERRNKTHRNVIDVMVRANECRFKEAICHKCNKKGHIKKACKGKKISDTRKLPLLGDNEDDESDSYGIYSVSKKGKDAIIIKRVLKRLIFQWN